MEITLTVNDRSVHERVEDRTLLVTLLREHLGLTGTKIGCDTTSCGACTVLLDGASVKSCTVLAAQADGAAVTTIEGLADGERLHPVQEAFREHHGLQCGYCTPGMVMAAVSLLGELDEVTEQTVRKGMEGNLCRCTGYHNIVQAILGRGEGLMIPAPFTYARPQGLEEAIALLQADEDAKVLAGGHSLIPLMKLRLATPSTLVDIGRIEGLSFIEEREGHIAIGAMTRHHGLSTSALLATRLPLLAHVAGEVGDPQVRHRGTIGGSLVHGDPASDLPAVVLALDATLVLSGPAGTREVAAADFFLGFLETATAPDEILTEVRLPVAPGGFGFEKFTRRAQDWAIVGAAVARRDAGVGIGLVNLGQTTLRASAVEAALDAGASAAEAAELAAEGTDPVSDQGASAEFRQHLARVLVRRALEQAGW